MIVTGRIAQANEFGISIPNLDKLEAVAQSSIMATMRKTSWHPMQFLK
jgi:hypothetical protein